MSQNFRNPMKKIILLIWICQFAFSGCKKEKEDASEPYKGKDYFPINTGHEIVYDVEHFIMTMGSGSWDTLKYQVKEITTGEYVDAEGRITQKIERYIDNDTTSGFVLYKTWAANILTSTAHRVEDGIRFVKLAFPQNLNMVWNGNSLNAFGERNYRYINLHVPLAINGVAFDSTCTIVQFKDSNAVVSRNYTEQYATGTGMISKLNSEVYYNVSGNAESGNIYIEKVFSYIK